MASSMSIQGAYETATCVVKPQINRGNAAGSKEAAGQGQSLKELKWVILSLDCSSTDAVRNSAAPSLNCQILCGFRIYQATGVS
jgi:hypothetical protein